jgi:hypothetical protein
MVRQGHCNVNNDQNMSTKHKAGETGPDVTPVVCLCAVLSSHIGWRRLELPLRRFPQC